MQIQRVSVIDQKINPTRALISVFDKRGIEELVSALIELNDDFRIYSTGGTYDRISAFLSKSDNSGSRSHLISVSEYTGQPEMQGGLVKTLDFKIYLGILSETYNAAHCEDLSRLDAVPFDLVVVNLYPFEEVTSRDGIDIEDARGHIDIGGPCMLRAAAKNFLRVVALCDPVDYGPLIEELEQSNGAVSLETRFRLAHKAFDHTSRYDRFVADYLAGSEFDTAKMAYKTT